MRIPFRISRWRMVVYLLLTIPVFGTSSCPTDVDVSALTITIEGDGTVEPCCTGLYRTGDVVRLTATPAPAWVFTSWRGNAGTGQSTNRVLDVVMDQDKNIIARFDVRPINEDDLKSIHPSEGAETAEGQSETADQ